MSNQHRTMARARDAAIKRLESARHELDRLGPIRRRLHPARRLTFEANVADTQEQVADLDTKVARLDRKIEALEPQLATWTTWATIHARELERLDFLDGRIRIDDRMDAIAQRPQARTLEHDLGLGIEL